MAFRFNFPNTEDSSSPVESEVAAHTDNHESESPDTAFYPAQEIIHQPNYMREQKADTAIYRVRDMVLELVQLETTHNSSSLSSITHSSDLVPGVYEGGLKIWECSVDLSEYLITRDINLLGQRVMELGCGAGLPGLTAIKRGAAAVDFQDYNSEVIKDITIPNVEMNGHEACKCRFFSGDWSSLPLVCNPDSSTYRYDVILTSETIYSTANYIKLQHVFDKLLKQDGIVEIVPFKIISLRAIEDCKLKEVQIKDLAYLVSCQSNVNLIMDDNDFPKYLAAKSTYFGVGGGTRIFEDFLKKNNVFMSELCMTVPAGVPREILKITRKTS